MRPPNLQRDPVMPPGICCLCRCGKKSEGEPDQRDYFVDFGIDIEWQGVMYVCNLCLISVVRMARLPDIIAMADVNNALADAQETKKVAERSIEEYQLVKNHLGNIGLNFDNLLAAAQHHLDAQGVIETPVEEIPSAAEQEGVSEDVLEGTVLDPEIVTAHENLPVNDDGSINTEVVIDVTEHADGTDPGTVEPTGLADDVDDAKAGAAESDIIGAATADVGSDTATQPDPPHEDEHTIEL